MDDDKLRNRKDFTKSSDFSIKDPRVLEREMNVNVHTYPYKSNSEYAAAVNLWLWQCYNLQCMAVTFPYVMTQAALRPPVSSSNNTIDFNRNFTSAYFPNQNLYVNQPRRSDTSFRGTSTANTESQGTEFIIPSLFKRIAAEVIDFCILLVLKVMITYMAVDFFDLVNLDKYDLDLIRNDKLDYNKAMQVTSEIIIFEVAHRFVVCLFEALCIYRGVFGNGGATPGKTLLRLRVVSCQSVVPVDSHVVRVYPAGDLGIGWALLRAFIKNFSMAFIFPIFFTMYFFQYNRTAYDIICNSIVVEELPEPRNRQ